MLPLLHRAPACMVATQVAALTSSDLRHQREILQLLESSHAGLAPGRQREPDSERRPRRPVASNGKQPSAAKVEPVKVREAQVEALVLFLDGARYTHVCCRKMTGLSTSQCEPGAGK